MDPLTWHGKARGTQISSALKVLSCEGNEPLVPSGKKDPCTRKGLLMRGGGRQHGSSNLFKHIVKQLFKDSARSLLFGHPHEVAFSVQPEVLLQVWPGPNLGCVAATIFARARVTYWANKLTLNDQ